MPARRSRPVLGLTLAALLLAGAACGGEEAPEGPLESVKGADESPSPSAAAPEATAPPLPPATDDEAGRRAFARWFTEAFAYGFATNDAAPITDVAATEEAVECVTCADFADFLAEREAKGIRLEPSAYRVRKMFNTATVGGVHVYTLTTFRPAYANVDVETGEVRDRHPADPAYPIEVGLRYARDGFELTGWKAGGGQ